MAALSHSQNLLIFVVTVVTAASTRVDEALSLEEDVDDVRVSVRHMYLRLPHYAIEPPKLTTGLSMFRRNIA